MWLIIILFAAAAVIGLTMAIAAFQGKFPPVPSAVLHGIFAASALVLLLIAVLSQGVAGPAAWALGLLLLAALGGFGLAFGFHARKQPLPKTFVAGHALLAALGFLILLAGALRLV